MKQQCESEAMANKLAQLDAILRTVRRTLEGNESSIFMQDTVQLVAAAGEITIECLMLRQKMDVQIYQKNSKYFQHTA
ncbi:hypothetical protein KOEU_37190 [Komagataeibacter europaeus]|uniref:Uncharacterized protein n=1 Tax=Komagataeibacter europaeus TaxID=33995 RepID=A0A0M0ECW5_KOMEU|nr:hypothetical protein [Komagataeibacter europaeus]KON62801.1 hypothetical protein KOEU_37190 [Komagataeibacter europaeus]